jgi:hypothetical protein
MVARQAFPQRIAIEDDAAAQDDLTDLELKAELLVGQDKAIQDASDPLRAAIGASGWPSLRHQPALSLDGG